MGGLAPGQLKSRRGWHSSPRRLHYRFSFFDRVLRTHCGKNSINFAGMAHSHRHRLAAAWPSLVRQIGPVLRRRRHEIAAGSIAMGLGGYMAAKSDAEHYDSERIREELEGREKADIGAAEVAELFQSYGLTTEESTLIFDSLRKRPTAWVESMVRLGSGL